MKMRILPRGRLATVFALVMLVVLATNIGRSQQPPVQTAEIKIDNFSFGPPTLEVPLDTTITWTNRDDVPHTVVSDEGAFKSKALDTDDKFSFTFSKAGTYRYFCGLHPKMVGTITVR